VRKPLEQEVREHIEAGFEEYLADMLNIRLKRVDLKEVVDASLAIVKSKGYLDVDRRGQESFYYED
jgi:hypothetical protein